VLYFESKQMVCNWGSCFGRSGQVICIVRLQYLSGEVPNEGELLKEKNWNPFNYKGQLFVSQVGSVCGMGDMVCACMAAVS
jgi:hypothetical protein